MPARACVPSLGKRELAQAPWRGSSLGKWSRSALTASPSPPLPPPSLPPSRSLSFPPLSFSPSLSVFLSPSTHTLSLYSISFVLMRTVSRIAEPGQEFLNAHQNLAVLLDESP